MKTRLVNGVVAIGAVVALVGTSATGGPQSAGALHREGSYNSTYANWAGYAVDKSRVSFSDVKATFTVPKLTCNTDTTATASEWVGLGGYAGTPAIEQTGVESDCSAAGRPSYYAWDEEYPNGLSVVGLAVHGGDVITSEVRFVSGSSYKFLLADKTTGKSFTSSALKATAGASRSTAEWIVERPDYPYTAMADTGTVPFSGATATGNGHAGPISYAGWNEYRITMQATNAPMQAATSALGSAGNSFTVTWMPPCARCVNTSGTVRALTGAGLG